MGTQVGPAARGTGVMGMAWVTAGAVVAVVAAGGLVVWRTVRVLRRRVAVEEARGLLTGAASHRDTAALRERMDLLQSRLTQAMAEQEALVVEAAVLEAAGRVVEAAWARYAVTERRNDDGGGQA